MYGYKIKQQNLQIFHKIKYIYLFCIHLITYNYTPCCLKNLQGFTMFMEIILIMYTNTSFVCIVSTTKMCKLKIVTSAILLLLHNILLWSNIFCSRNYYYNILTEYTLQNCLLLLRTIVSYKTQYFYQTCGVKFHKKVYILIVLNMVDCIHNGNCKGNFQLPRSFIKRFFYLDLCYL